MENLGLGQPSWGPERPHPSPLLFWFGWLALPPFVLFCTSTMMEPSLVSSALGFQCTRPRWPLWGFCGSRNHFVKDKRNFKGFSFVLSASLLGSESPESGVPHPF